MSFFRNKGQEGKIILFEGWYQWDGGGYKERM
jgi:hypothetical protein